MLFYNFSNIIIYSNLKQNYVYNLVQHCMVIYNIPPHNHNMKQCLFHFILIQQYYDFNGIIYSKKCKCKHIIIFQVLFIISQNNHSKYKLLIKQVTGLQKILCKYFFNDDTFHNHNQFIFSCLHYIRMVQIHNRDHYDSKINKQCKL